MAIFQPAEVALECVVEPSVNLWLKTIDGVEIDLEEETS